MSSCKRLHVSKAWCYKRLFAAMHCFVWDSGVAIVMRWLKAARTVVKSFHAAAVQAWRRASGGGSTDGCSVGRQDRLCARCGGCAHCPRVGVLTELLHADLSEYIYIFWPSQVSTVPPVYPQLDLHSRCPEALCFCMALAVQAVHGSCRS